MVDSREKAKVDRRGEGEIGTGLRIFGDAFEMVGDGDCMSSAGLRSEGDGGADVHPTSARNRKAMIGLTEAQI